VKVEFYRHNIGQDEKEKVLECLAGVFLTTGEYVCEFEARLAQYLGLAHAVGLNSCTAALHLSLLALGIGVGDEVITTPMTFVATATAIRQAGAKPVFVDVEPATGLIDPARIEAGITRRTKAIIPVHLYGQMCDMRSIRRIADEHGLKVIEDAAHCLEGKRGGIGPGQLGDVACFSFYATKNITCGEGGAIATNHPEVAEKVRLLRMHGMSTEAADRYRGNYRHWDLIECGWKYNMDNIQAALLIPQLSKIDDYWEKRRVLYGEYIRHIKGMSGVDWPKLVRDAKSAYHLFTVWVASEKRDEMLSKLGKLGIGVAVNYRAIHLLTYFRKTFGYRAGDFPVAERIGDMTITLPFYVNLRSEQAACVAAALGRVLKALS